MTVATDRFRNARDARAAKAAPRRERATGPGRRVDKTPLRAELVVDGDGWPDPDLDDTEHADPLPDRKDHHA